MVSYVGSRLCRLPCAVWWTADRSGFCWTLPKPQCFQLCGFQDCCPAELDLQLVQEASCLPQLGGDSSERIMLESDCTLESTYRQAVISLPLGTVQTDGVNFSTTVLLLILKGTVWRHCTLLCFHGCCVPWVSHYKAGRIAILPAADSAAPSGVAESVR